MHYLDIIVLIILSIFLFLGFKKGFISQIMQVVALFLSFLGASPLGKVITKLVAPIFSTIHQQLLFLGSTIAAFIIIFLVVMIVEKMFMTIPALSTTISAGNRLLGAIVGSIKGFMLIALLIFLIRITPFAPIITNNVDTGADLETLKKMVSVDSLSVVQDSSLVATGVDSLSNVEIIPDSLAVLPNKKAKLTSLAYQMSKFFDPTINEYKDYLFNAIDETIQRAEGDSTADSTASKIK